MVDKKTKLEPILEGEDERASAILAEFEEQLQRLTKDLPNLRHRARKELAPTSKKQLKTVIATVQQYNALRSLEGLKAQPKLELETAEAEVSSLVEQYIEALDNFKIDCQAAAKDDPELAKKIKILEDNIEHLKKDAKEPWNLERAMWQMRTLLRTTSYFFRDLPANTWSVLKGVGARLKAAFTSLQALTAHSVRKEAEKVEALQKAVGDLSVFTDVDVDEDDFYLFDEGGNEKLPKAQAIPVTEVVHKEEVEPLTSELVDEWISSKKDGCIELLNEQRESLTSFIQLKSHLLHGAEKKRPSFFSQRTLSEGMDPNRFQRMLDEQATLLKECQWIKGEAKQILREAKAQEGFELTPVQNAALQAIIKEARKIIKEVAFSTPEKVKVEAYQQQIKASQETPGQTQVTTGPGFRPSSGGGKSDV